MAVKSSGALSFATDIVGEFSDSTPHSLSEFYKGGGKVPDAAGNGNVPTSGAISMGDFYGAVNRTALSLTIASNQSNYNIFSNKGASYVAGVTDVTLTINSGATVGTTSTAAVALDTGTGWASGDTITIINNGLVKGQGGNGGDGGDGNATGFVVTDGTDGTAGGNAFRAQFATTIDNNGTFAGGGGGGGGGAAAVGGSKGIAVYGGGGGGGGAGVNGGSGGSGGTAINASAGNFQGQNGSSGTATAGGAGGTPTPTAGGNGGGLGANGSVGASNVGPSFVEGDPGFGGTRGNYAVGNLFITWSTTGTRLGGVS